MAVDEALLESARGAGSLPTLRWYGWEVATLSLGYFQSASARPDSLADLPLVRRLTGGGAIVHDRELTYSLVFPAGTWPRERHLDLVLEFHRFVAEAIRHEANVQFGAGHAVEKEGESKPFLCFERRADVDLVLDSRKVVGSAQRVRGGILLQHGSILLAASRRAPRLWGLADFGCRAMPEDLIAHVTRSAGVAWNVTWIPGSLTDAERARATELTREKYAANSWNRRS